MTQPTFNHCLACNEPFVAPQGDSGEMSPATSHVPLCMKCAMENRRTPEVVEWAKGFLNASTPNNN